MRIERLDLLRGVAAILVMLGHVRSLLFVDFRNVRMPTIADRLFYFLTSLGHDAVVVFFVLSGYFVGGSVAGLINKGRWSWQDYGIQRIVRLWTVLIPGLLLTAAWDELGLYNATARYYFPGAVSSQNAVVNQQLGIDALIGNVLFLQTILVPTYGSNGPLWSLANEFWYYVLFPLIALTLWTRSGITGRVTCLVMALIILVWLPTNIVAAFGIWILGYVAYEISISGKVPLIGSSRVVLLASSALLLGSLTLRRLAPLSVSNLAAIAADYATAILVAILIVGMTGRGNPPRAPLSGRISQMLANSSYTLYVFHYPFCLFVASMWFCCDRFQPDSRSYAVLGLFVIGTWLYCFLMYLAFEARTDAIRASIRRWVRRRRPERLASPKGDSQQ